MFYSQSIEERPGETEISTTTASSTRGATQKGRGKCCVSVVF